MCFDTFGRRKYHRRRGGLIMKLEGKTAIVTGDSVML
jgi:hypothetical protein